MPSQRSPERPGRGSEPAIVVYHGEESFDGDPIEPEEQHAEVVQPVPTLVTIGGAHMREDVPLGTLPPQVQEAARTQQAHIAHQTSAGELAQSMLQRCQHCAHFDPIGWSGMLKRAETSGSKLEWEDLNTMRGELSRSLGINPVASARHDLDKSGDVDLEHALKSLGLCTAISEHLKDTIIVYPLNPCAMPDFFKPRYETKRAAASGYDWILRKAQGR